MTRRTSRGKPSRLADPGQAGHHAGHVRSLLLRAPVDALQRAFGFPERPNLALRYNVAPTQTVPLVRRGRDKEARELALVPWGLVPSWAKDAKIGAKMVNARAEGIAAKPTFWAAFNARRCLVPADGLYEWKKLPGGKKQPMLVQLRSREPFAFAELWESWRGPTGRWRAAPS